MRKKAKYEVGDRVSFMSKNKCTLNGNRISGITKHFVGYVKQVRHTLLGIRYVICVAKSDEVRIVPEHDIFGKVEKREKQINNE